MVRSHGVNLLDVVRERYGLVYEELYEVMRRRLAGEKLELLVDRPSPSHDHTGGNLRHKV